ncbi:ATP-dependent zinc metalloprotease FtsH [Hahella sp. CR1]|uniref:ATP-dependent zinc metalloprotease FtsH n=1 Tax=unclassified Hahella TaxID=2624107 RepID=UPI0024423169|nr:ATP-dependent zinc metalloprotease FtsH [Hahella sp. CR1]MDG9670912.1 ATP-dependent zinc metalloprotease FtsH [Hahella sp. CR1]
MSNTDPQPPQKLPLNWVVWTLAVALMLYYLPSMRDRPEPAVKLPYSEFKMLLREGQIGSVTLRGSELDGKFITPRMFPEQRRQYSRFLTQLPDFGNEAILAELEEQNIPLEVKEGHDASSSKVILLSYLPWIMFMIILFWLSRRTLRNFSGRGGAFDFDKRLETQFVCQKPDTTFDEVAGQTNAKREVQELVEYLRDPDRFHRVGALAPRGVLLMGPPGTGKTLLARALAGEAGVNFYPMSASEFIEVFVGVGASRVRQLFKTAKETAPSIIFIDELDSVGRTRGAGYGGGHDEREQTLNQILAEMDGFAGHDAVIVLAATNRPDVLDPALMRPGRFDRHVTLDLPDQEGRVAILKVHAKRIPLADDVNLPQIAAGTPGFSGADLKNLINEAAIQAARENRDHVHSLDFDIARDKIIMGAERTLIIPPDEKHRLAVHESGHTLVAYYLPNTDPLYKVSIVPHGRSLGGTHQMPLQERHTYPEEYLRDKLAVMLAGRIAERELLGSVSTGADDDIHQATGLARAMVSRWGMSKEVGPVDLRDSEEHPFLGREMAQPHHHSEFSAEIIDKAVRELLVSSETIAAELIRTHRERLDKLVSLLERSETLHKAQIDECLQTGAS